jgi:hypothetical protein
MDHRTVGLGVLTFVRLVVIHDRQGPELPPRRQRIADEVHAPAHLRPRGHRRRLSCHGHPLPATPADRQPQLAVEWGSKLHLTCGACGTITAFQLTAGQVQECTQAIALLESVHIGRSRRPHHLASDRAYATVAVRQWGAQHHVQLSIPERVDHVRHRRRCQLPAPAFDRTAYRGRNVIAGPWAGSSTPGAWQPGPRSWPRTTERCSGLP